MLEDKTPALDAAAGTTCAVMPKGVSHYDDSNSKFKTSSVLGSILYSLRVLNSVLEIMDCPIHDVLISKITWPRYFRPLSPLSNIPLFIRP